MNPVESVNAFESVLPDGAGKLVVNPFLPSGNVSISQFDTNGNLLAQFEVPPEEYERFIRFHPQLELPSLPRGPGTSANGNTIGKVVGETPPAPVPAAESNPPVAPETEAEVGTGTKVLDGLQLGLDAVGLIPGAGEIADLANAGISALRGDFVGAGLSLASAIPFLGYGATAAKVARKGAGVVKKGAKAAAEAEAKAAKQAAELAKKKADEAAAAAKKKADDAAKKKKEDGGKVKKRDCKQFQKGPPGATHQGGRHGQVQKDSAALTRESHHIPPDSVTPNVSRVDGPAISMDYADHRALSSTGRASTHPTSIAQANLVASGPAGFLAAMLVEIAEIQKLYPGKYDAAIAWMLLYAACMGYIPGPKPK